MTTNSCLIYHRNILDGLRIVELFFTTRDFFLELGDLSVTVLFFFFERIEFDFELLGLTFLSAGHG